MRVIELIETVIIVGLIMLFLGLKIPMVNALGECEEKLPRNQHCELVAVPIKWIPK